MEPDEKLRTENPNKYWDQVFANICANPPVVEKLTKQWDKIFKQSEYKQRDQGRAIVAISNFKPSYETARNIYKEDRVEIEEAAKKNGFKQLGPVGTQVSFIKVLK